MKRLLLVLLLVFPSIAQAASLSFPVNTAVVNCGSAAVLDNLGSSPFSIVQWVYPTGTGATALFASKENGTAEGWRAVFSSTNRYSLIIDGSTDWNYQSANNTITANTWQFYAGTFNSGNAAGQKINLYKGTPGVNATELSYASAVDGVNKTTESAQDMQIGALTTAGNLAFPGYIAFTGIWNRELTLGEIRDQQNNPHVTSGNILFVYTGYAGTGNQADWSGYAHTCTNTGGILAAGAPLGAAFGMADQSIDLYAYQPTLEERMFAYVGFDNLFATL
jgi:hypothetical protein